MNNKGFAITSIIYGLMLLFVLMIASFLTILVGRNRRMDDLISSVQDTLEYETIEVKYDTGDNKFYVKNLETSEQVKSENADIYVTPKRAKYSFDKIISGCIVYLPKNTVVITNSIKTDSSLGLYYGTGSDLSAYKELCPNYEE